MDLHSFYIVPATLPGGGGASEPRNGEPGDLQDYWGSVEVAHG